MNEENRGDMIKDRFFEDTNTGIYWMIIEKVYF